MIETQDTSQGFYRGYFVNEQGVEYKFVFEKKSGRAMLFWHDGSHAGMYQVIGGTVPEGPLNARERLWLRVCWSTAKRLYEIEGKGELAAHVQRSGYDEGYTFQTFGKLDGRRQRVYERYTGSTNGARFHAWRAGKKTQGYPQRTHRVELLKTEDEENL